MRSRTLVGLLVAGALALALPAYPQGALRQELETGSATVPAGGMVTVQSVVSNTSSASLTGSFSNLVTIDRGTIVSVTSANPAIEFARVPSSGSDSFRGIASDVTLRPDEEFSFYYRFFVPVDTSQGTRVRFQSTVTGFQGQVASGLILFTIQGTAPSAPQLTVSIAPELLSPVNMGATLSYLLDVRNIGNAPTMGPIDIDITFGAPFEITPAHVQGDSIWTGSAGQFSSKHDIVLPPGGGLLVTTPILEFFPTRGQFTLNAVVTGGGSPRAEATDVSSLEERMAGEILVPTVAPGSGRVRP